MACNGFNHYEGCNCGWGGMWHGYAGGAGGLDDDSWLFRHHGSRDRTEARQRETWSRFSQGYTDPNATCPVCGAPVYFYESPYGGRVFFDELGPPWPKHPCTDNPRFDGFRPVVSPPDGTGSRQHWIQQAWKPWGRVYIDEAAGVEGMYRLRTSGEPFFFALDRGDVFFRAAEGPAGSIPLPQFLPETIVVYFRASERPAASAVRTKYKPGSHSYELSILDFNEATDRWTLWEGVACLDQAKARDSEPLRRRAL